MSYSVMTKLYRMHSTDQRIAGHFRRILVTGASGNLGRALAIQLAESNVSLCLWGRNMDALTRVAQDCRAKGAQVSVRSLDLVDIESALHALEQDDALDPFDAALLVAGIGDTRAHGDIVEDPANVARLAQVNFAAPAAMATAIAARMAQRGTGRIGLIGTAAAFHSIPFAAAYSGSKAGLWRYGDALRLAVRPHGVRVSLVAPGFFTAASNEPRRPGEIPVEAVAARTIRALQTGRPHLVTPWTFALLRWIDRLLPRPLRDRLLLSLKLP